jgi:predicted molibdopterin-dependent oxidoreductase YjgC
MATPPLFRSLAPATCRRTLIEFDGQPVSVLDDVSLASALLEAGIEVNRLTPVSGAPRAPYCMMGVCFDCLVQVNGVSQRACQLRVSQGMRAFTHRVVNTEGDLDD